MQQVGYRDNFNDAHLFEFKCFISILMNCITKNGNKGKIMNFINSQKKS